jgi:hypothetical protein
MLRFRGWTSSDSASNRARQACGAGEQQGGPPGSRSLTRVEQEGGRVAKMKLLPQSERASGENDLWRWGTGHLGQVR